jgi:hypothetical protein
MLVNAFARYEVHKGFGQRFALYPWYDGGRDCENRQGRDRKDYEKSDPSVRQPKQSESKGDLAERNSDGIYRQFRRADIHHFIKIAQID